MMLDLNPKRHCKFHNTFASILLGSDHRNKIVVRRVFSIATKLSSCATSTARYAERKLLVIRLFLTLYSIKLHKKVKVRIDFENC